MLECQKNINNKSTNEVATLKTKCSGEDPDSKEITSHFKSATGTVIYIRNKVNIALIVSSEEFIHTLTLVDYACPLSSELL